MSDDKRRQRISKELANYGQRVQYSVFECIMSEMELNKLTNQLEKVIKESTDSIRMTLPQFDGHGKWLVQ
nr:CRISPR-associated endonuclease Cas2 [Desulfolucanica intricata]